ncbi:MAG: ligase-associated DNA damage response DEXH box helicase [Limnohabitans sp.]|nr:ligase-associated DNA damage response DEXH box helicase [Limnohabitans sp.]
MSPKARQSSLRPCRPLGGGGQRALGSDVACRESVAELFFASRGWLPHAFQRETWQRVQGGESGLVQVPTGSGKTYAAYFGFLDELCAAQYSADDAKDGLRLLYVSPLRAVSRDIEWALRAPMDELGLAVTVGARTGDTSGAERARQRERLPNVLVTTPESLSLLVANDRAPELLARVRGVIVDEWHELLASKRGVQVELALARLRRFAPKMRTWGLSATLRNIDDAARILVGVGNPAAIVRASIPREIRVTGLLPDTVERFPWAGHLGLTMLKPLVSWLDPARPTLVFTNTRSQAERWFAALSWERPEWRDLLALHHGSVEREQREEIEGGLKSGRLRIVVATSSLDLGVDFSPVERVVQIGSPKGIARLIQRAGRSGHRPGASCEVLCVPTHALELVEIAAARRAIEGGEIEERHGWSRPLDCLVQHLVTCGVGGGFRADELFDEVRSTASFAALSRDEFDWCLDLAVRGGRTLTRYEQFHRLQRDEDGIYRVSSKKVASVHRLNIGSISADATISVSLVGGRRLGSIEESFIARLNEGDAFLFAGDIVEFVRLRDMTAWVRRTKRADATPRWNGSRFPLSTALAKSVRRALDEARRGIFDAPEMQLARPVLEQQMRLSALPSPDEILVECGKIDGGQQIFLFPFEGRLVHEGLAVLLALRFGRRSSGTLSVHFNDYGLALHSDDPFPFAEIVGDAVSARELFSTDALVPDLLEAVNLGELSRRQFRDIARVAGLVFQRYPGAERSGRQVQAGAGLIFDVLREFDPENLLLLQSEREVVDRQFEGGRLARALARLAQGPLVIRHIARPTPLSLPLIVDRLGTTLSTEGVLARLRAICGELPPTSADGLMPEQVQHEGTRTRETRRGATRYSRRERGPL